ncbi:T9SS type A sorting domain-containing protein [Paracrocinitomix mangrovi]|uniref:T9SS type A sorting domain-containing protein n=1 Tax=Paracrocinitomix mangrovi TaxID=2862509 RepID=UPI001C8E3824|nr:T9SS type A sorting domain-containing protein [Paracrocinitomix mangrovi]UKN00675.1 T9SS type A sorting domain-containing protein [Paracrocinitomix mangrovi]
MKFHLTLFLTAICMAGFSQNYQSVRSTDVHYFMAYDNDNDYDPILAIACDSVDFVSGDSILYPFKALQNNYSDTTGNCYLKLQGSWIGEKIIVQPNGVNVFFNQDLDSIFIHTLDTLGQVSLMMEDQLGFQYLTTVTDISEVNFLGYTDTVKTFSITSDNTAFNLSPAEIKLSKNHGVYAMMAMFSFPVAYNSVSVEDQYELVGQDFPTIGITKPTNQELFDIEIGDIINYTTHSGSIPYTEIYHEKKILDKTVNGTTATYTIEYKQANYFSGYIDMPSTYSWSSDTVTESYDISNVYYTNQLPGQTVSTLTFNDPESTLLVYYSGNCGYKITSKSEAVASDSSGFCFHSWHIPTVTSTAISGALDYYGSCYDVQSGGCNTSTSLNFKYNSGVACGTQFFVSTETLKPIAFKVFPNPSKDYITIESNGEWTHFVLFNANGMNVLEGVKTSEIDISILPAGMYFLQIESANNEIIREKIVKY